ncbi:MAG: hypothetical protein IPJ69_05105 [Deltaproteobacteria bacterium]|nr:MAG: hypothetical protein IPJ69_05105 [Deltaproteobacteria bacterium]
MIAVTGTNGKSTVVTLLYELFKKKAFARILLEILASLSLKLFEKEKSWIGLS